MATLSRLYNFTPSTTVESQKVDDELNQLVSGHNDQEDRLEVRGVWRPLVHAAAYLNDVMDGGVGRWLSAAGQPLQSGSEQGFHVAPLVWLNPTDFVTGDRTAKMRLTAALFVNNFAPQRTIFVALSPISSSGGVGDSNNIALANAVAQVAVPTPAANSLTRAVSAEFPPPDQGWYALSVFVAQSFAADAVVSISSELQVRHI